LKDNFIENAFGSNYTLRFDNINFSVPKGGFKNLIVKASVLSNPEIKGVNYEYTFAFTNATTNAIRGKDGVGLDQYANRATTNQVTVDSSSTGTVTASLNSATPKLGFILGNATATTSNKEILKTDFKVENKDVTIKTLAYTMTDASSVVSAVKLYDGSTLVGSVAIDKGKATFTNLNINIAKDTTKTLTLSVDIKPNPGVGAVVKGALVHTDISGVDASDNSITKTKVTVTGKEQRVYTKSPFMALVSTNIVKTTQAGSADVADATVIMNVTANGGDIYINKTKGVLPTSTAITTITENDGDGVALVTSPTHGLTTGQQVTLKGTAAYDGTYTVTVASPTTFTLGAGTYTGKDGGAVGSFSR